MFMRKIGIGLVFALAALVPVTQAKACPCHEKTVSTCNPCATKTVSCKPSCWERLTACCHRKPKCGCDSTVTYRNGYYYGNGYYNSYPTTYETYSSYSGRTYPSTYRTYESSNGRYLTFEPETGRYVPYPTFESSPSTVRTINYRD